MAEPLDLANYPELLLDLANRVEHKLVLHRMETQHARAIAWEIAEHVRQAWGGAAPYIPKGMMYEITREHLLIWNEFTGDNHQALALKHDTSVQNVYRIVKRVGDEERRKRQRPMFED